MITPHLPVCLVPHIILELLKLSIALLALGLCNVACELVSDSKALLPHPAAVTGRDMCRERMDMRDSVNMHAHIATASARVL